VTLCDKVVFMAPGGWLAFFGPPREALAFFGVETFADIYVLLGQPGAPEEWARRYAESPYHAQYVNARIGRATRISASLGWSCSTISCGESTSPHTTSRWGDGSMMPLRWSANSTSA